MISLQQVLVDYSRSCVVSSRLFGVDLQSFAVFDKVAEKCIQDVAEIPIDDAVLRVGSIPYDIIIVADYVEVFQLCFFVVLVVIEAAVIWVGVLKVMDGGYDLVEFVLGYYFANCL